MNLDADKNIQLTVVHPQDENEINIDFSLIWRQCKRLFLLWLVVAVAVAAIGAGVGIGTRNLAPNAAKAFIQVSDTRNVAAEFTSPLMIETALNESGISVKSMDDVRNNLVVSNVMSEEEYDQRTMYYNLISKNGGSPETIDTLLNTKNTSNRFLITFDYTKAELNQQEGTALLDALLNAYSKYFNGSHNENTVLGSVSTVMNYEDYDYAENIEILTGVLDAAKEYLVKQMKEPTKAAFRSVKTGYTLNDLLLREELLREVDLNKAAAEINVNSLTKWDKSIAIAHYNYLIENINRDKNVQQTRLASLQTSLNNYERDPQVYTTNANGQIMKSEANDSDAYDMLVQTMLDTQDQIARLNNSIRYYQNIVSKIQANKNQTDGGAEAAEEYLQTLITNLNQLIDDINNTMLDYSNSAFQEHNVTVLVPANVSRAGIMQGAWVKYLMIAEVLVLVGYLGTAVIKGIIASNAAKKEPEAVHE